MSGTLAPRYRAGLTYDPSLAVGQYGRLPSPGAVAPPTSSVIPVTQLPQTDASGVAVRPGSGVVSPVGGGSSGAGGGLETMLLLAGLGALPYLPQAYDAVSDWFGPREAQAAQAETLPTPPQQMAPPEIPGAEPFGMSDAYGQLWGLQRAPGLYETFDGMGRPVGSIDMQTLGPGGMDLMDDIGDLGGVDPASFSPGAADAGGALVNAGAAAIDDPLYGVLGETPIFGGDFATGLAGLGGGALGGLISAQNPWTRQGYGGVGQQAGAGLGGIGGGMAAGAMMGAGLGPLGMFAGALGGAFLGGQAGAGIGSQIGPQPTIGRNFGTTGTFGGDGNIYWGQGGGDNGGTADDANAFANWFGGNLMQQAAAQGLAFNPNMEGVQFNIGGYDQWSRNPNLGGVGGFFYDPYLGGSPENYALRPMGETFAGLGGPGFTSDQAFGADMTGAFTNNVLADLAARGVFTQAGAAQPGRDFYQSTWGADLGSYAPGMSFQDAFGQRQGAINGWLGGADLRAQAAQQQAANYDLLYGAGSAMPDPTTGMVPGAGGGFTWNIAAPGAE